MENETELKSEIFVAFSHPIRRQIIEFIAEEQVVSYTELTEKFNLKSGPLYHHLRRIKEFITQNEEKKYILTEEGKNAVRFLTGEKDQHYQIEEPDKPQVLHFGKFSFAPLINFFSKNPYHIFIEFFILAAVLGYLGGVNNTIILGNSIVIIEIPIWLAYIGLFGSWIFLAGASELLSRFFYKKKEDTLRLFGTSTLLFIPAFLFILIVWLIGLISGTAIIIPTYLLLICHGIFQIWSFIIIATALGVIKEISVEKSAIISLIVNYTQIMIVIFVLFS